jgi:hypothetical protein
MNEENEPGNFAQTATILVFFLKMIESNRVSTTQAEDFSGFPKSIQKNVRLVP